MHSIVVRSELNAQAYLSQRSLQPEPIFRLLLKVAVNGTHQCDSQQFLREARFPRHLFLSCSWSACALQVPWEASFPQKMLRVTLMRPIHGNLE